MEKGQDYVILIFHRYRNAASKEDNITRVVKWDAQASEVLSEYQISEVKKGNKPKNPKNVEQSNHLKYYYNHNC